MRPFLVVAAVALAILAWTGFWFYSANRIEQTVAALRDDGAPGGAVLSYRDLDVEGYPFRLIVRLSAPQVDWPARPGRPSWRAQQFAIVLQPWNLRHLIADLSGRHDLAADLDGKRRLLGIDIGEGLASLTGSPQRPERLSMDLKQLALTLDGTGLAVAEKFQFHLQPGGGADGLVDLAASVTAAVLQRDPPVALGPEIATAEFQASVTGTPGSGALPLVLAGWRDSGGELAVRHLRLDWDGLEVDARGNLALDGAGHPAGTLTTRLRGHERLLDAAVAAGQMSPDVLPMARTALGLLAAAGGGALAVPVTLQEGNVFLGPVKIARLRPLF